MRIYIACALTQVPREIFTEYTEFVHKVAFALATDRPAHEVKYALVDSDPQLAEKPAVDRPRLCYLWDRHMVEEAELLIAEGSFPSIGLGIEMQIAEAKNTPIILCYRDFGMNKAIPVTYENPDHTRHNLQIGDGFVSPMALGVPGVFKKINYVDAADGTAQLVNAVRLLAR